MAGRPIDKALQCLVEAERMLNEATDAFRMAKEGGNYSDAETVEAWDRLEQIHRAVILAHIERPV